MKTRKTNSKLAKKQPRQRKPKKLPINQLVGQGEFEAEEKLAENFFSSDENWPRKSKGADEEL